MQYGYGIDVGGTTIKIGFFSEEGRLVDHWEIPTDCSRGGAGILPDIARAVDSDLSRRHLARERILGIGIGLPGAVTPDGVVHRCVNLGWGEVPVRQVLGEATGLRVAVGNDANVAALGECWKGSGRGAENMVFVTLGTGIGGGIVLGGKVLHGAHGGGGEIGHITIHPEETERCGCGKRGCAEQYGSATGIVRRARAFLAREDRPSCLREIPELECRDVFEAGKAGDGLALEILEQVYEDLGLFLANVCCVCDPELVVLGGGVAGAGEMLTQGVRRAFRKYMFHTGSDIPFALASLGNDAGIYGAFRLLLD